MRKLLWIVTLFVTALSFSSCEKPYDDTEIWNSVNSLEQRMTAMETVVNAYEKKLFIESVTQIENGYIICFSDGSKATIINGKDGDTYIEGITIGENEVTFKLTDGKQFSIPLYSSLSIKFDTESIVMASNSTREVQYTVESILNDISIEVISSADIKAKAIVNKDNCMTGRIEIKFGATIDEYSKVVVLVSNGEKVIMKTLKFEQEEIKVFDETNISVSEKGGEVELLYLSNVECEVIIPDSVDWISIAPATKTLEQRSIKLLIKPNTKYNRSVTITLQTPNKEHKLIYLVVQKGDWGETIDPIIIPNNEIWYRTQDKKAIELITNVIGWPDAQFNTKVISNTYQNGIGKIIFAEPLTYIKQLSFAQKENLISIYLPSSLSRIGVNAFFNCYKLEEVYIGSNNIIFDERTNPFACCELLSKFSGPLASADNKCLVVDETLLCCAIADINEYIIPEGVKIIGRGAIGGYNLKTIVIPEGVEEIREHAVHGSSPLEYVYLPSTLKYIDNYAFVRNQNIKAFYGNSKFISDDNYSLINHNSMIAFASGANLEEYTIPEGIEYIEHYTFYYAESLKTLHFPDSYKAHGSHAFEGATNISKITGTYVTSDNRSMVIDSTLVLFVGNGVEEYVTPKEVNRIGDNAIAFQNSIKRLIISDEVKRIDRTPFYKCTELESITISANVNFYEYPPFETAFTPKLTTVYLRSKVPASIGYTDIELNLDFKNLTIYVPEQSLEAYKSSPDWAPYRRFFKGYQYTDLPENDTYISSDYSNDGKVTTLQTATKGNGINIVLMGDAYSDRQIADGSYKADIENLYNNLFTEEPYKSFKDHFNVYYVNVVSATEGYEYGNTALDGYFGDGTLVGGNDNAVFNYALKAISEEEMDEALLIVAMNSDNYAGTCYMYYPETNADYGKGVSVSYFPRGGDAETFAQILHHEACGHGFAKLADEYAYEDMGEAPSDYVSQIKDQQANWGWWKNVDFTSDASQVRWKHFLNDSRYQYEGLGAYEGGLTYWSGVWRPTENSIMRYNTGGFNAPSREAIYYRIHKLAYGDEWEYDYEEFVEWDAKNRKTEASATRAPYRIEKPKDFKPTAPPVVINKNWRDVK